MNTVTIKEVENLARQLPRRAQLRLVKDLSRDLYGAQDDSTSLRGFWKGKLPEDFDVDTELNKIRSSWQKEWNDLDYTWRRRHIPRQHIQVGNAGVLYQRSKRSAFLGKNVGQ